MGVRRYQNRLAYSLPGTLIHAMYAQGIANKMLLTSCVHPPNGSQARRERMAARRHSERLRREGFVPASGLVTPTTTAMDGASFDTPSRRAPKAAAAAAITAAAAALRRPHLDRLEPVDKSRVRRELLRARLHTHVQRELARHVTLAAAVFDESSPR